MGLMLIVLHSIYRQLGMRQRRLKKRTHAGRGRALIVEGRQQQRGVRHWSAALGATAACHLPLAR